MPTVPRYEQQTVGLNPVAIPRATALGAEAYGAGLGQGLEKAGAISAHWNRIEAAKQDKAIHDGAEAKAIEHYNDLTSAAKQVKGIGVEKDFAEDGTPNPGALNVVDHMSTEFSTRLAEITKGMTPDQLDQFKPTAEKYRIALKKNTMEHYVEEKSKWQDEQFTAKHNLKVLAWAKAPDGTEDAAASEVMRSLAEKYSGDKLKEEEQKITQAVNYQRATDAILVDPVGAKSVIEKYKGTLTEEHKAKLADLGRNRINVISAEKSDAVSRETILPAITNKTFIPSLATNPQYSELAKLDPAKAVTITKNTEQYNAGLAVDNFDVYMTGIPEARRSTLTMAQLPESISGDLKKHAPSVYNRLSEKFDAERILRQERAAADKAFKSGAANMMLQSFINPTKINQNEVVSLIQSGQMDPKLGLGILERAQKGGNIEGKLRDGQFARTLDDEATYMASGVLDEKKRKAAKERILGTIYDALVPMFNSTTEVTPDAVQSLLTRMRRATVEEIGRGQVYALGVVPSTNVRIPKQFQKQAEELAKAKDITVGQAWGIMSATHNLGQSFGDISQRGGVK